MPCSISGRVATPLGHGMGRLRASLLTSVRCRRLVAGLAYFSPSGHLYESCRWHTIWWTDITPQRGVSCGDTRDNRIVRACRSLGLLRVFTSLSAGAVT